MSDVQTFVELTAVESAIHQVLGSVRVQVDHRVHRGELARADPGQLLTPHRGGHRLPGNRHPLVAATQPGQPEMASARLHITAT
jgi:hypothetical protein